MTETSVQYVEQTPQKGWRVAGSRVSLDSVIHAYKSGRSADDIVVQFPSLTLEQVHGALAFYLRNRSELEQYLAAQEQQWQQLKRESDRANADLVDRLRASLGTTCDPGGSGQ